MNAETAVKCPQCGIRDVDINPKTSKFYSVCKECLKKIQATSNKRNQDKQEKGICISCDKKVQEINPKTGKLYCHCKECRKKRQTKSNERWKKGICRDCNKKVQEINPKTGNLYHFCKECRLRSNKRGAKRGAYCRKTNNVSYYLSDLWANMKERCGSKGFYKNIQVKITRKEWMEWATPRLEEFQKKYPTDSPSVDRIDSKGHYEFGNIRITTMLHNALRSKFVLPVMSNKQEKEQFVCKAVVIFCKELGLDLSEIAQLINYTASKLK